MKARRGLALPLLVALTLLVSCRSAFIPKAGTTYRAVTSQGGAFVETVLAPRHSGSGWLLLQTTPDSVYYALLDSRAQPVDSVLPLIGTCAGTGTSAIGLLSVSVIDNPITRRPLLSAFVDALAGPSRTEVGNIAGAKADSQGIARIPRRWEERPMEASVKLTARDTMPIPITFNRNGRDTTIYFRPGRVSSQGPSVLSGPAQILQVKWRGQFTDVPIDTAALPRDLTLSLGLGITRATGPIALTRKGKAAALSWRGRQHLLAPSAVPAPGWCRW